MRGLEEKNDTIKKVLEFGKGYVIVLMESDDKVKFSGGTLSWRNRNPGNLKFGDFAKSYGALRAGQGGHAIFPTYEAGRKAMEALLFDEDSRYVNLSIFKAISRYAPVNDPRAKNRPKQYSAWLAKQVGVQSSVILNTLSAEQRKKLVASMIEYEGYEVGKVSFA